MVIFEIGGILIVVVLVILGIRWIAEHVRVKE